MGEVIVFTGGALETNGYLIPVSGGYLCVDAPEDMAAEIRRLGVKIVAVLLTHGHFDHYWDAAEIAEAHQCPVYCHRADWEMIQKPVVFSRFVPVDGLRAVADPLPLEVPLKGTTLWEVAGKPFRLFHIPGHSLGSVLFYDEAAGEVFGGDVLFASGIGRWDFPGGSQEDLVTGIQNHLLSLPDGVKVHPGHGPSTTIGRERRQNPYLV
jgi:glyoxylase-like metal-dependent hydrolase (beta-lactamase superfamily II)